MMSKITKFTKQNLPQVRSDINKILKEYADENGFTINLGNIRFNNGEFTAKLETKIIGAVTMSDTIFERQCAVYNLGKLGIGGRELTGYNTKAHAYPFMYTQNGKNFKCTAAQAKEYFSRSAA